MSERVDVSLVSDDDYLDPTAGDILCRVEVVDSGLIGRDAVVSIIAEVEVQDSRGVNDRRTLFSRNIHWN